MCLGQKKCGVKELALLCYNFIPKNINLFDRQDNAGFRREGRDKYNKQWTLKRFVKHKSLNDKRQLIIRPESNDYGLKEN